MAEQRWYLSIDGQQEGEFAFDEVRARIQKNQGRRILVWTQGMAQWADPAELPQFKAPIPTAPAPPGVAPAPSPSPVFDHPSVTKIDKDEIKKQAGVLKGLLDFRFETFIAGKIIPVVYIIVMIVIGLAVLFGIVVTGFVGLVDAIRFSGFAGAIRALAAIILAPIMGILYLALVRIWFEFLIIIFRIKQDLTTLVERSADKGKEKEN